MKTITGFEDAQLILDPVPDFTPTERGIVLICPGGGYRWLSGREDAPIARAFARYDVQRKVLHRGVQHAGVLSRGAGISAGLFRRRPLRGFRLYPERCARLERKPGL